MPEPAHKRQLISTVYATPLMTPTTDPHYGLSIRLSMFELRETGDWDIFLGPPERARTETGGADQWMLKRRECSGFARVNQVTSASLRYPLPVFNKNSTLKVIFGEKSLSSLFRILRQDLTTVFPAMNIVLPQQKVRKIDHVRSTCVLVGLKDVQRFSVHLLLVSFGHCRSPAASQVTGRKDMEVPYKFTQP